MTKHVTTIEMLVGHALRAGGLALGTQIEEHERARELLQEALDRDLVRVSPGDTAVRSLLDGTSYPRFNSATIGVRRGFWSSLHQILARQPAGADPDHRTVSIDITTLQDLLRADGIDMSVGDITFRVLGRLDAWFLLFWQFLDVDTVFHFQRR